MSTEVVDSVGFLHVRFVIPPREMINSNRPISNSFPTKQMKFDSAQMGDCYLILGTN